MNARRPPRWARALARFLVHGTQREFVLGDLDEMYGSLERTGPAATAIYLTWAFRSAIHELRDSAWAGIEMDVRVALRQFRRYPRVYLGGALVLAVGLGTATLTWGVHYGAVGRDLPVSDPDRVLSLHVVDERTRAPSDLSVDDAEVVRALLPSIESIGLWTSRSANLTDDDGPPEEVATYSISADLLRILEITPFHGRTILAADELPGAPRVAVLGYRRWRDRYGEDPGVVGTSIRLDGDPTEIVGVLPPGRGLTGHEDLWLPVGAWGDRSARDYYAVIRVAPRVTPALLGPELAALASRLSEDGQPAWVGKTLLVTTFSEAFYGGVDSVRDRVVGIGGALLFVMALVNVANLFLVATRVRAHEL